jgi:hypothetical protein
MSVKQPPLRLRHFDRPSDDLDSLLHAFYRSEVPDPWPHMKAPDQPAPAVAPKPRSRWSLFRSRFALAATVALCLTGLLALPALHNDASLQNQGPTIGEKHRPGTRTPTIRWERLGEKTIRIQVFESEP